MNAPGWTPRQVEELTMRWLRGDTAEVIGAAIGRSASAVCGKASSLKLKPRYRPTRRANRRMKDGIAGEAIDLRSSAMEVESGRQSDAWARLLTDARFDDNIRASKPEPMLRGRAPENRSVTGCSAALAAAN